MKDLKLATLALQFDGLADQAEAAVSSDRQQGAAFPGKAVDQALVGGAVDALIGVSNGPFRELTVEVLNVDGVATGQEVALRVSDTGFYLALGLRPVGPA